MAAGRPQEATVSAVPAGSGPELDGVDGAMKPRHLKS